MHSHALIILREQLYLLDKYILWDKHILQLHQLYHLGKRKNKIDVEHQGRINVPRGPWHIIRAAPLTYPPPPQPPNGILDTEFSKTKKYPFVFQVLKSFLCIYKKIIHE